MSKGFRINDSIILQDTIKYAIQIKEKIEHVVEQSRVPPDKLPESLVPTKVLYDLASCFEAAYHELLDQELVKTGNLKSDKNNIH